jgi:hypothetical protein
MKKYIVTTEVSSIPPLNFFVDIGNKTAKEIMCDLGLIPVDPTPKKSLVSFEISQEVFDFIENTFNTEFDLYGEKTYICNKIRMKIKEKQ